ncbi:MAG: potassium-transporting ATPase subunit KdpC [bacterium]
MKTIITSSKILLFATIFTGIIYPLLITLIAQLVFPSGANGSLYFKNGKLLGSLLLGQNFTDSTYFHPRPSVIDYNPVPSGASNLGLTSKLLHQQYDERLEKFLVENNLKSGTVVPSEMLFASASGVDPHISKQAAYLQVDRIIKARNFPSSQNQKIIELIDLSVEYPQFGFLGDEVVNVLKLNIKLDGMR